MGGVDAAVILGEGDVRAVVVTGASTGIGAACVRHLVPAGVRVFAGVRRRDHAWVYSSGELSGHFAWLDRWVAVLSWQRELEVARREDGVWRLFGYQR